MCLLTGLGRKGEGGMMQITPCMLYACSEVKNNSLGQLSRLADSQDPDAALLGHKCVCTGALSDHPAGCLALGHATVSPVCPFLIETLPLLGWDSDTFLLLRL